MEYKNVIAIDAMGGDNAPAEIIKGAIDLGSTYGTWLNEGTRLEPNKYYELPDQGVFYLGSKENMFFMGMK